MPIPLEYLDNQRKTIIEFSRRKSVTQEDDWRSAERSITKSTESWKGRTIFKILSGGIESKTSVPARPVILPVARLDHQKIWLTKASLKTAQRNQEQPKAFRKGRYR